MISINDAIGIVKDTYPGSEPRKVFEYKDKFYLIFCKPNEADRYDPFYLVSIEDGSTRFLNPVEDIEAFSDSINNRLIKTV